MRQPVSERSYRCRRIIPYSLQRTYTLVSRRELPTESFHHLTRSSQQITGPAIIAQSLPQFHHLVVIGGSQYRYTTHFDGTLQLWGFGDLTGQDIAATDGETVYSAVIAGKVEQRRDRAGKSATLPPPTTRTAR